MPQLSTSMFCSFFFFFHERRREKNAKSVKSEQKKILRYINQFVRLRLWCENRERGDEEIFKWIEIGKKNNSGKSEENHFYVLKLRALYNGQLSFILIFIGKKNCKNLRKS